MRERQIAPAGAYALADVDPPASRSSGPNTGPDHVQGGGSFPRAVWMARTIVEARASVNQRPKYGGLRLGPPPPALLSSQRWPKF